MNRGAPFGEEPWAGLIAGGLGLEYRLNPVGRRHKNREKVPYPHFLMSYRLNGEKLPNIGKLLMASSTPRRTSCHEHGPLCQRNLIVLKKHYGYIEQVASAMGAVECRDVPVLVRRSSRTEVIWQILPYCG